ncbi:rRNA-processing protein NOP12 ASCRUDRAFT_24133, partial [Ascoidea rubescens DSM 1968]
EAELQKAERTIFIGNLSSSVVTNKSDYKLLKEKFLKYGAIESIRFRSISFQDTLPRKLAIKAQNFHNSRDTLNCYLVFKEYDQKKINDSLSENNSFFLNNHLRVDSISHPIKKDNNRSIFIGNINFEEKEENLRNYFVNKLKIKQTDVEYVRIVRDPKTNVGKGFAYLQFNDFIHVSKALLLNDKEIEYYDGGESSKKITKGRTLRISRCRTTKPSNSIAGINSLLVQNNIKIDKNKFGRANKMLSKSEKAKINKDIIIEGSRAQKGKDIYVKNGKIKKSSKVKKPRISERSKKFRLMKREEEKK